jgi:hypothetical protein
LIDLGFSPLLISERLGHENVEMTLCTYAHLYQDKHVVVPDKLNILFAPENGGESIEKPENFDYCFHTASTVTTNASFTLDFTSFRGIAASIPTRSVESRLSISLSFFIYLHIIFIIIIDNSFHYQVIISQSSVNGLFQSIMHQSSFSQQLKLLML